MSRRRPFSTRSVWFGTLLAAAMVAMAKPGAAHNPIFTPGPHLVYGGGLEATIGYARDRASGAGDRETGQEVELELEYGLTADWTAEMELPLVDKDLNGRGSSGLGDIVLRSRYRFLRLDTPGVQRSAAVLGQVKLPTGDDGRTPRLGSGSTDLVGGLLYGHESRRWYYNLAARYRLNTEGAGGLEKGDRQFLDVVGGVRPVLTGYLEPDAVVFLELNWETLAATSSTARTSPTPAVGSYFCRRGFLRPTETWRFERVYKFPSPTALTGLSRNPIIGSSSRSNTRSSQ